MGAKFSKSKGGGAGKEKKPPPEPKARQKLTRRNVQKVKRKLPRIDEEGLRRLSTIPPSEPEFLTLPDNLDTASQMPPKAGSAAPDSASAQHPHAGPLDDHDDHRGDGRESIIGSMSGQQAAYPLGTVSGNNNIAHHLMREAARGDAEFMHPEHEEQAGSPTLERSPSSVMGSVRRGTGRSVVKDLAEEERRLADLRANFRQDVKDHVDQHLLSLADDLEFLHTFVHHKVGEGMHFMQNMRNPMYKRDGFADYAKAIRRHRISAGAQNPIYFDDKIGGVCRRDPGVKFKPLARYAKPTMTGKGIVEANDIQSEAEFVCPVVVGNPPVTLILDFDTGSSDLWVWSSLTRVSRRDRAAHHVYDPRNSHTSQLARGLTWEISYADGSHASGRVFTDTVTIGGVMIHDQAVEVAEEISPEFAEGGSDGLLGLAFPRLNTVSTRQKTPVQNMIDEGLIHEPVFTCFLEVGEKPGFYTFGYIQKPEKSSEIYWTNIISENGYWEFHSHYMKFGNQRYERVNNTAILDTGTTLILLHDTFVNIIYSAIPGAYLDSGAGGYIFPTNTKIPPLSFCVGKYLFTIPGKALAFSDAGHGMSFGSVQSRGGNPQDILGDVFLKYVYAVFWQGNPPKLGIAQRAIKF